MSIKTGIIRSGDDKFYYLDNRDKFPKYILNDYLVKKYNRLIDVIEFEIEYESEFNGRFNEVKKIISDKDAFAEWKIEKYRDNNKLDSKLVSGNSLYKNNVKDLAQKMTLGMSSSQIRNFYDEALHYSSIKDMDELKSNLMMLVAKVAYAHGRNVVPKIFYNFIDNRVAIIDTQQDYEDFMQHFQALVAYFKYFSKK